MKKLTNREIVRIHDMARFGRRPLEISRELEISHNTVTAHLMGDITYSGDVRRKISPRETPLVADGWLCRRTASPWLPGHPSPAKMRVLMTSFTWLRRAQTPPLQSALVGRRRVTKIEWIAAHVASNYPRGIWVRVETVRTYTEGFEPQIAESTRLGRRLLAFPLHIAYQIAHLADNELMIPPGLIHRAVQIERHVGTALI